MAFFKKKEVAQVALIDIGASSVGGALATLTTSEAPTIHFSARLDVDQKEHEDVAGAMLRTLEQLSDTLLTQGAPTVHHATGSGHVNNIIVSVSAPWQKTLVRAEHITKDKPFVFTHALLSEAVSKEVPIPDGFYKADETVIATMLNGYEIAKPFGKKVSRADLIVMSSLLDKKVADAVEKVLRKTYHTHSLQLTAFGPLSYSIFRDVFPHEKDFVVLHIQNESTDIAFIKRGLLVSVSSIECGVNDLVREATTAAKQVPVATDQPPAQANETTTLTNKNQNVAFGERVQAAEKAWIENLEKEFQNFSTQHPLPRTIFLLTDDHYRDYLKNLLDAPQLRSMWLTEDPLRVIPIIPSNLAFYVKTRGDAENDTFLSILALFANKALQQ